MALDDIVYSLKIINAKRNPFLKKSKMCCICGENVRKFLPYRLPKDFKQSEFLKEAAIVGSDIENFSCPLCFSTDRERHLKLYFEKFNMFDSLRDKTVLHFAPELGFGRCMDQYGITRIKADLFSNGNLDLLCSAECSPFPPASFDAVIINHVLEHVHRLGATLSELARVLKPKSFLIAQTPYSSSMSDTIEDISAPLSQRIKMFGQEDHVRLFGLDIFKSIESYGFEFCGDSHANLLGQFDSKRYGVNPGEPFMIFQRI